MSTCIIPAVIIAKEMWINGQKQVSTYISYQPGKMELCIDEAIVGEYEPGQVTGGEIIYQISYKCGNRGK